MRAGSAVVATLLAFAAPAAAFECSVDISVADARDIVLELDYRCSTQGVELSTDSGLTARHVVQVHDGAGRETPADGFYWRVGGDSARVRIALGELARRADAVATALRRGDAVLATLPTWLLQPSIKGMPAERLRLSARLPPGWRFLSGLPRQTDGSWLLEGVAVRFAGYTALGTFAHALVPAPPLTPGLAPSLDVAFFENGNALPREAIVAWLGRQVQAQARLWGGFADRPFLIAIVAVPGPKVRFGRVVPGGGPTVMLQVGVDAGPAALYDDWVLPHELVHTRMPFIRGRGAWLMEGAATYWEPIVRARAGWKSEADVWKEWIENMPRGLAPFRSGGLNDAQGQANYWGGALFHLLLDMEIRTASGGARGLEDCYRAILHGRADAAQRWSVPEFAAACDKAVDARIASRFVDRYVFSSEMVDLNALWRQLGVSLVDGEVRFDDAAPQAAARRLIVLGPSDRRLPPIPVAD